MSLAIQKTKVLSDEIELIHQRNSESQDVGEDVLKQTDRMLIRSATTRKALTQFCNSRPQSLKRDDFDLLLASLQQECPPLAVVLNHLHDDERAKRGSLPIFHYSFAAKWHGFLETLASTASAV